MSEARTPLVAALASIGVLALASCGGDDDTSGEGGDTASIKGTEMTFASWGGEYQAAQKKTMAEPFSDEFGVDILQDGPTDYAKIETQVRAGQVNWDVVDVDPWFGIAECGTLLEPIDTSIVDTSKMPEEFVSECGVPSMHYSIAQYYDTDKFAADPPQDWADFFDPEKYPGKRAVWNDAQSGLIEAALLADGVPPDELFPLDLDRAFAKMDEIKDDLVYWDEGAQSQQMMESQEVEFVQAWLGRGYSAIENGAPYEPVWNQAFDVYDSFVVPKGTENTDAAMKFIAYATGPEAQASLDETLPYAPINSDAKPNVTKQLASFLPTNPKIADQTVVIDQQWWAENRDEAEQRWTEWVQE